MRYQVRMHPTLDILVSSIGEVFVPANGTHKAHWTFGSADRRGYRLVRINGKNYRVHRLVAETFIPNPENLPTADHYPDRSPSNNAVSNLRWADMKMQSDNTLHVDRGLSKYGVRECEDKNAYHKALLKNNPEYAERRRSYNREYMRKLRANKKA